MPKWAEEPETPRKLAIICSKGTLDGALPSLIVGQAAVGEGIETHLFYTFWGLDVITKKKIDHLKVTPVGNTSMPIPQALAPMPGMIPMATRMIKKGMEEVNVPPVSELLDMIVAGGGTLWACRMSVDMMHLSMDDFVPGVKDIISAADFLELAEGGQIMFT